MQEHSRFQEKDINNAQKRTFGVNNLTTRRRTPLLTARACRHRLVAKNSPYDSRSSSADWEKDITTVTFTFIGVICNTNEQTKQESCASCPNGVSGWGHDCEWVDGQCLSKLCELTEKHHNLMQEFQKYQINKQVCKTNKTKGTLVHEQGKGLLDGGLK